MLVPPRDAAVATEVTFAGLLCGTASPRAEEDVHDNNDPLSSSYSIDAAADLAKECKLIADSEHGIELEVII